MKYEVWQTGSSVPLYSGHDPEETILWGLKVRRKHTITEVLQKNDGFTKRLARWDD